MTVRKRLYFSNMLMIIVPVLLSAMIISVIGAIIVNIAGTDSGRQNYNQLVAMVSRLQNDNRNWDLSSPDSIKRAMDAWIEPYKSLKIYLALYEGDQLVYGVGIPNYEPAMSQSLLSGGQVEMLVTKEAVICLLQIENYTLSLIDMEHSLEITPISLSSHTLLINIGFILFIGIVTVIITTNRLLTRMVLNHINIALDTLAYGVQQISGGNLEYRIDYHSKDEFLPICADFNEMATRLQELVQAQQKDYQSRRVMIAGISHDLRTPLTSIKAYVEGLTQGVAITPLQQEKYARTINSKIGEMEHLIQQLFMFSKLDAGESSVKLETINLGEMLADYVRSVSEEYQQKGLRLTLGDNVSGTHIQADRLQLQTVIQNVMENSVKYGDKEQAALAITSQRRGEQVVIELTDNGPGVPEEMLENIFAVFYRGDAARSNPSQGSGLGLAIASKIIQHLGGSITATNATPHGLRISITLPVFN